MNDITVVRDLAGRQIAMVRVQVDDERHLLLTPVQRFRSGLLHYYFQEGGREVFVAAGDICIRGELRTSMDGTTRIWVLKLKGAETPAQPDAVGDGERTVASPPCSPGARSHRTRQLRNPLVPFRRDFELRLIGESEHVDCTTPCRPGRS